MARDYSDYPERESRHIVKNERNDYQDKFFHDIDLDFLLDAIMNIELEGYSLNIVNNKLQLLDNDGDVVSEVDISQGSQGPVGPTPNISMNASVDSNIGTPSVEIVKTGTAESPVFSLAFHNLKGQKGDPGESIVGPAGQPGVTPVVSATASVDSNTGTPGVTVTKTGTTENPIFNFAFTNIKGATGAASTVPGPQGEPGTPFQVKAQYDTWADFIAAHPTGQVGDAYQVGSNDEYYTKSEVNTIVGNIRQVPDSTGANAGDVLTHTISGDGWYPPVKELPAIAAGDAGKVLSVNSGETGVEWTTPQGGGGMDKKNGYVPFGINKYSEGATVTSTLYWYTGNTSTPGSYFVAKFVITPPSGGNQFPFIQEIDGKRFSVPNTSILSNNFDLATTPYDYLKPDGRAFVNGLPIRFTGVGQPIPVIASIANCFNSSWDQFYEVLVMGCITDNSLVADADLLDAIKNNVQISIPYELCDVETIS